MSAQIEDPGVSSKGNTALFVENASAPDLCCIHWHPTHAIVTLDGKRYKWNARSHRKLRFLEGNLQEHPAHVQSRIRAICWEPKIVTWYICWVGVIANTLWVINGYYAVWPEEAYPKDPLLISYTTGAIGAFLFIVTGYLGYVEAINQTYRDVKAPSLLFDTHRSNFHPPLRDYGRMLSPLGEIYTKIDEKALRAVGIPLIYDEESKAFFKPRKYLSEEDASKITNKKCHVLVGNHKMDITINSITLISKDKNNDSSEGYVWWTWDPDLHHIGIVNALVFFVATIIFFIPACVWYPMADDASLGNTIFWVYVLQIIPSIGFAYVGHAGMAEASGSWIKPRFNAIGWWISLFNTIGGYGFLLDPILFLPAEVNPEKDYDTLIKWGASFATFWGSCCFWIAGILMCVEFSSQHPITVSSKK